jgi:GNAT superfamily N-acetyltransferase
MTGALKTVDLGTVQAWVDGWVISRSVPPPVRVPWGLLVEVGEPGHVARHILHDPTPATLRYLSATITRPGTWLKLCAPVEDVVPWLGPHWSVDEQGFMMTSALDPAEAAVPHGYVSAVVTRSGVTVARVLTAAGEVAARGQVAVSGETAVIDRVRTAPHHRRRGLGGVIMTALATAAVSRGATTGVLVATPAGQALYRTLGWTTCAPMTAAVLTSQSTS